jgi:uncharacterized membrane protein YkoI
VILTAALGPAGCARRESGGGRPAAGQTADEAEARHKASLAAGAQVTIQQAVQIASGKQPGRVIEVEIEEQGGKAVWEVEIVSADGRVAKVAVDAATGTVVSPAPE